MYVYLRCKRPTQSQSTTTGVLSDSTADVWTGFFSLIPAELGRNTSETLRDAAADIDVRKLFNIFVADKSLDVQELDRLVEVVDDEEIDAVYVVRGVERWKTRLALLVERVDE